MGITRKDRGQWVPGSAVTWQQERSDLTEEALVIYGIPTSQFRQEDGIPLAASETADTFNVSVSANVQVINGELSRNETETSEGCFQFILPAEYVNAGDVKIRIKHNVAGTGTLGTTKTIDVEVFEQTGGGAIGSDICTTAAQTMVKGTWTTSDFVVTGTNLITGDILNVVVTTAVQETGNSADLYASLDGMAVLLDIKG